MAVAAQQRISGLGGGSLLRRPASKLIKFQLRYWRRKQIKINQFNVKVLFYADEESSVAERCAGAEQGAKWPAKNRKQREQETNY